MFLEVIIQEKLGAVQGGGRQEDGERECSVEEERRRVERCEEVRLKMEAGTQRNRSQEQQSAFDFLQPEVP